MLLPCDYCKKEACHGIEVASLNHRPIGTYYFCDWDCLRYLLEIVAYNWQSLGDVLKDREGRESV